MNIHKDAIEIFGAEAAIKQCIEECSELIHALCKYDRGRPNSLEQVEEEVGDVQLCLNDMYEIFDKDKIEATMDVKRERVARRIATNNRNLA